MNLAHTLALILSPHTFGFHVGESNLRLVKRLLSQFSVEEANAIMHHRKPLFEGESEMSLIEAIDTIRDMETRNQVSPTTGDRLIHSLTNARNLRSVALELGDISGSQ